MDITDRHLAAENAHDIEATLATYMDDTVWDDVTHRGSPFRGEDGRLVADESILAGRVQGSWTGAEGDGAPVRVRILHVFELREGLIACESAWFDTADVVAQVEAWKATS